MLGTNGGGGGGWGEEVGVGMTQDLAQLLLPLPMAVLKALMQTVLPTNTNISNRRTFLQACFCPIQDSWWAWATIIAPYWHFYHGVTFFHYFILQKQL